MLATLRLTRWIVGSDLFDLTTGKDLEELELEIKLAQQCGVSCAWLTRFNESNGPWLQNYITSFD